MIDNVGRAFALATMTSARRGACAKRPARAPGRKPAIALPVAPKQKLHTEFVVEVNNKGQVAAVKSKKGCPDLNLQRAHARQRLANVDPQAGRLRAKSGSTA